MSFTPATYEGDHLVLTGPIGGTVTLDDGTVVDVSGPVVEAFSTEVADEIAHKIALRYEAEGHPEVPEGFQYDQQA